MTGTPDIRSHVLALTYRPQDGLGLLGQGARLSPSFGVGQARGAAGKVYLEPPQGRRLAAGPLGERQEPERRTPT